VAADPFDADTLLVGSGLGLFRSVDRGQTFEEVDLSFLVPGVDIWAVAFAPASPGTAYASGTEGDGDTVVLKSTDGGVTWEALDVSGLFNAGIHDLQVDAAGNVYVATRGNGIFRLRAGEL
jgi:photosystem II stability/assembly factor-like uncharacterized protein